VLVLGRLGLPGDWILKKKEYYYRLALVLRNASYMLNTCKSNVVFGELKNY